MTGSRILLSVVGANFLALGILVWGMFVADFSAPVAKFLRVLKRILLYEALILASLAMLLPFYWMVVSSFKDSETALKPTPVWGPVRIQKLHVDEATGAKVAVRTLEFQRKKGDLIKAVPEDKLDFKAVTVGDFAMHKDVPDESAIMTLDPAKLQDNPIYNVDPLNFLKAWYAPEASSRGQVDFGQYFWVSIVTGVTTTIGVLITSALAAFAFAKMDFIGKGAFFHVVLLSMMVPAQVLLIPDFLILSAFNMLDTWSALIVPWLASVFTIFLMRQFFMTVPDDLWDAAQIDGSGRLRFLVQVIAPLSKPVFITAGLFAFLSNWNSLLWPLIVTSSPKMRTLMVGLQAFNEEAGNEFQLQMAAATLAILPVVILFFVLQRFFIEGIARTGLK